MRPDFGLTAEGPSSRAHRNQPNPQPAWGLSYFCLQVSEGWSPHFPGLLVVHKCCPPRSGRGLSSYLEHMQGGGTLEVGVLGGTKDWPPIPSLSSMPVVRTAWSMWR